MNIFFYSDPHFGHKNVIKYCNRPFEDVAHMKEELIRRYNEVVGPNDLVYWLGDCFFCGVKEATEIMARLNGKKVLIRGNHDRKSEKMLQIGFDAVLENAEIRIANQRVKMCHFPYRPEIPEKVVNKIQQIKGECRKEGKDSSWYLDEAVRKFREDGLISEEEAQRLIDYDLRYFGRRLEDQGHWLLCGHVHDKWAVRDKMINVGTDVRDYTPVHIDVIRNMVKDG